MTLGTGTSMFTTTYETADDRDNLSIKYSNLYSINKPPEYNTGGSSVFHRCDVISKCPTERLHKYITYNSTYLKIDTEGGEYKIVPDILGAVNYFSYIGIEYHRFNSSQSPLELHNLLKSTFKGKIFC